MPPPPYPTMFDYLRLHYITIPLGRPELDLSPLSLASPDLSFHVSSRPYLIVLLVVIRTILRVPSEAFERPPFLSLSITFFPPLLLALSLPFLSTSHYSLCFRSPRPPPSLQQRIVTITIASATFQMRPSLYPPPLWAAIQSGDDFCACWPNCAGSPTIIRPAVTCVQGMTRRLAL